MRHALTSFPLGTVIYVVNSRYRVIDIRYMLDLFCFCCLRVIDSFLLGIGLTSGVAYICM